MLNALAALEQVGVSYFTRNEKEKNHSFTRNYVVIVKPFFMHLHNSNIGGRWPNVLFTDKIIILVVNQLWFLFGLLNMNYVEH